MSNMVKEVIYANGMDIARYKSDELKDVIKNWMRGKDTLKFF